MMHLKENYVWLLGYIVLIVFPIQLKAKGIINLSNQRELQNKTAVTDFPPDCDSLECWYCQNDCPMPTSTHVPDCYFCWDYCEPPTSPPPDCDYCYEICYGGPQTCAPPEECPTCSPPEECGTCSPPEPCPTCPPEPPQFTCEPPPPCPTLEPSTCPPPIECPGCPSTTTEPPSTCPPCDPCPTEYPRTCAPCPTSECPAPAPQNPKFTRAFYQSSLPTWPIAGTILTLGINASTPEGHSIQFKLESTFDFLSLAPNNHDIIFTSTVSDGAFVGPNNVMLVEVVAEVVGWEERSNSATVALVFPRPRAKSDKGHLASEF